MIDPDLDAQEKLPEARELYQQADAHYDDCNAERHRCARNYHNTGGDGQWDEADKQYLEEEGRPALTFNFIKRYIDTTIGMHMDMRRKAAARPVGTEDRFLSDVLEAICDRVDKDANSEAVDAEVMRDAYVVGEGNGHCDVTRDPKHLGWVKFNHYAASPYDVLWDPGSTKPDRSDATYVCYSRWLGKSEFSLEYPEHKDEWQAITEYETTSSGWPDVLGQQDGSYQRTNDYDQGNIYYDRYKKRARVIHVEYAVPRKRLVASINGETVEVTPEERELMQLSWQFEGVQFSTVWDEDVHALEFVGTKVLYDSTEDKEVPYQPFDGVSIEPFVFAMDTEENVPYSAIRNAIDPQGRVNKAFSILLEHLVGQHRPGYIHEKSAIDDVDGFESSLEHQGTSAEVNDGALTGNKVQPRPMPQPSAAGQQQIEISTEMLERVFGLGNDLIQPAAQQEAATTVAIRYHKSQLSLSDVRRSYDKYQREIKRRKLEMITRAMPDDQIAALLGNDEKYRVQNGMVMEIGPSPDPRMQGQPVVLRQANLRDLRSVEYNIELESTTGNTTLRMLDLQTFMQAAAQGVPVDPLLIVDKMADNRAEREQLRAFVQQTMQAQAQQQQLEMKRLEAAIGTQLQIEAGKVKETSRHNVAEEQLQSEKQALDAARRTWRWASTRQCSRGWAVGSRQLCGWCGHRSNLGGWHDQETSQGKSRTRAGHL
jgi:hypothetical protein